MRKVLITGIAGFAGSHLAERLSGRFEVWGTVIDASHGNLAGIGGLRLVDCDLTDPEKTREVVAGIRPEVVYHLAGQSLPSVSFGKPAETLRTNIFSTLNLFEAIAGHCPGASVLNIGSADEYGDVRADELPVTERAELRPLNPYAVSKVAQDLLAFQYWKTKGVRAVRARPFNHMGPRQSDGFVASEFARKIAEIEAGLTDAKTLNVGNLEAAKDFSDVRDIVAAYELLAEKGAPGEVYNICSGRARKVSEIADTLLSFSTERIQIVQDPSKRRPTDTVAIYGDNSRIRALGWTPEHAFEDTLLGLLEYWRGKVGRGA